MGHRLDRVMYEISIFYIALPIFIFLAGWLRLIVALPVCAVFLISVFLMLRNRPAPVEWHLSRSQTGVIIFSLIILAVWVFFSGMGGFSFQNSDYQYRNAIFHDLIEKAWPVVYDYSAANSSIMTGGSDLAVLTYYIAFWLPGALVGKLFGWFAANAFLYFWAFLGLVLIVYFLFRTLRSASIRSVLILVFFSGLDILGYLLLSKGKVPGATAHIEWWSGLQYSSNTTLLFWVFNQTITIWLAILLIMNLKNSRSLFFLYAMLLLHGPFPFLGMLPIVLWKAYQGYPLVLKLNRSKGQNLEQAPEQNPEQADEPDQVQEEDPNQVQEEDPGPDPVQDQNKGLQSAVLFFKWFWGGIRRAFTFENVCGGITVLAVIYLYLSNNVSGGTSGINKLSANYYIFVVFEFGLYMLLLFFVHNKNPLYWICLASLFIVPFFRIGLSQDFCMRVSIPALFVMQILIQQMLLGRKLEEPLPVTGVSKKDMLLLKIVVAVLLTIGTVVPLQEMSRSVVFTLPAYRFSKSAMVFVGETLKSSGNSSLSDYGIMVLAQSEYPLTWSDSIKTLEKNKENAGNFIGPVQDNVFYEYLARR